LPQQDASSGNSFLSMIMMLSMSIGVALAGTLINVFMPTNCSEFNVPNKKKCKVLNQVGVSTVMMAKEY
jgi:hypothetical protein